MTHVRLPQELLKRLGRFGRYLAEADSQGIQEYGHPIFSGLRKTIENRTYLVNWPKRSGLKYASAEVYARELGEEIILYAMNAIHEVCNKTTVKGYHNFDRGSLDWRDISEAGKLCDLGWAIMFYGEG